MPNTWRVDNKNNAFFFFISTKRRDDLWVSCLDRYECHVTEGLFAFIFLEFTKSEQVYASSRGFAMCWHGFSWEEKTIKRNLIFLACFAFLNDKNVKISVINRKQHNFSEHLSEQSSECYLNALVLSQLPFHSDKIKIQLNFLDFQNFCYQNQSLHSS